MSQNIQEAYSSGNIKIASMVVDKSQSLGKIIPSVGAVDWARAHDVDIRPRLVEPSGEARLVDSGSQISVTKRLPGDKLDNSLRLVAVNGSKINTYGVRTIPVKINRKQYDMPAVICDVDQDILGFDFLDKYKLGFQWEGIDQSDLKIVDKKAKIKKSLQIYTVPKTLTRIDYLEVPENGSVPPQWADRSRRPTKFSSNEVVAFEVACMKSLEKEEAVKNKTVEEQLSVHDPKYVELVGSIQSC